MIILSKYFARTSYFETTRQGGFLNNSCKGARLRGETGLIILSKYFARTSYFETTRQGGFLNNSCKGARLRGETGLIILSKYFARTSYFETTRQGGFLIICAKGEFPRTPGYKNNVVISVQRSNPFGAFMFASQNNPFTFRWIVDKL